MEVAGMIERVKFGTTKEARCGKSKEGNYVEFSRTSPQYEQGFPGDLEQQRCHCIFISANEGEL